MKFKNFFFLLIGAALGLFLQKNLMTKIGTFFFAENNNLKVKEIENAAEIKNNLSQKNVSIVSEWHDSKLTFSHYQAKVPMYLDEPYSDSIGDKRLNGLNIIKIRRHQKAKIILNTKYPITIYRISPEKDHGLSHNYEKTNIKVQLNGYSSTHKNVLKKEFQPGKIVLSPGGPIAASPVLFKFNPTINKQTIDITSDLQYLP